MGILSDIFMYLALIFVIFATIYGIITGNIELQAESILAIPLVILGGVILLTFVGDSPKDY